MPKTKVKQPKVVEPFWKECVAVFLNFMEDKFGANIEFVGSSPRDLKNIIKFLHQKSNEKGVNWSREISCRTLNYYLEFCWLDSRVVNSTIWFTPLANKFKEDIYESITQYKQSKQGNEQQANGTR